MLIIHCKFFKTVVTVTTTSEYNRGDDFLRLKREELWIRNYQSVEFGANFHSWNIYHICHIHMVFKFSWEKFWSHVPHTYGFQIFHHYWFWENLGGRGPPGPLPVPPPLPFSLSFWAWIASALRSMYTANVYISMTTALQKKLYGSSRDTAINLSLQISQILQTKHLQCTFKAY